MSVMVLSDKHINTLVCYAIAKKIGWFHEGWNYFEDTSNIPRLVKLLSKANIDSFNERYGDDGGEHSAVFAPVDVSEVTSVRILKALDGYTYNCDNWTGWETSEALAFVKALQSKAIRLLDGYDIAEWTIG